MNLSRFFLFLYDLKKICKFPNTYAIIFIYWVRSTEHILVLNGNKIQEQTLCHRICALCVKLKQNYLVNKAKFFPQNTRDREKRNSHGIMKHFEIFLFSIILNEIIEMSLILAATSVLEYE